MHLETSLLVVRIIWAFLCSSYLYGVYFHLISHHFSSLLLCSVANTKERWNVRLVSAFLKVINSWTKYAYLQLFKRAKGQAISWILISVLELIAQASMINWRKYNAPGNSQHREGFCLILKAKFSSSVYMSLPTLSVQKFCIPISAQLFS